MREKIQASQKRQVINPVAITKTPATPAISYPNKMAVIYLNNVAIIYPDKMAIIYLNEAANLSESEN